MKKEKNKLLKILLVLMGVFSSWVSIGAYIENEPQTITQPNGQSIQILATGDEFFHRLHDANDYTIILNPATSYFVYAELEFDNLIPTTFIVGEVDPTTTYLTPGLIVSASKREAMRENSPYNIQKGSFYREAKKSFEEKKGESKAKFDGAYLANLVVYVRFNDQAEYTSNQSTWNGWFNTNAVSMNSYFDWVSYNKINVSSTFYPTPSGTTVVSYKDSHNRNYFLPKTSSNPAGYAGASERRVREHQLLEDAVNGVKNDIPSTLNLDGNNDGKVDNVVFMVRGQSAGWSELLWPHRWALYSKTVTIHGKRVYDYNFMLEQTSGMVAVLCHEMGHTLGAPDLYRYQDRTITPLGKWGVMAHQTNPPQSATAYTKWKYWGFIDDIEEVNASGTHTLNPVGTHDHDCAVKLASASSSEYFVVEHRRKTGSLFEGQLYGSGLLVYRINDNASGNGSGPPDEIYVYRPYGTLTTNGIISSAYYSNNVGRTAISNSTNPKCFLSNGQNGNLHIYGISSTGPTMSFNYNRAHCLATSSATKTVSSASSGTSFTAHTLVQTSGAVLPQDNTTYTSGYKIDLKPGLETYTGRAFFARIEECGGLEPIPSFREDVLLSSNDVFEDEFVEDIGTVKETKESFNISPNPASGKARVQYPNVRNRNYSVEVYDFTGRIVSTTVINQFDNELDFTNFQEGLYIVKLLDSGNVFTTQVIISK